MLTDPTADDQHLAIGQQRSGMPAARPGQIAPARPLPGLRIEALGARQPLMLPGADAGLPANDENRPIIQEGRGMRRAGVIERRDRLPALGRQIVLSARSP